MSVPRYQKHNTCSTTLESALQITHTAPLTTSIRPLSPRESLVHVHFASLNPVDYKLAELPIIGRMTLRKPATPGLDFSGTVVETGLDCDVEVGQRVFGKLEPNEQFGTLGEYVIGSKAGTVAVPDGVSMEDTATLGVCGLVTYQCLVGNVKPGQRILINGGSEGTGTFAVQIAKALGCSVTTTCSGANVQLYDIASVLARLDTQFDMVFDNVGQPSSLYWKSPAFTRPGARYIQIGSQVNLPFIYDLGFRFLVPTWLGGGQRPFAFGFTSTNHGDLVGLAEMVRARKVKPIINEVLEFKEAKSGYAKL